jgi:uncharacterized protein YggE
MEVDMTLKHTIAAVAVAVLALVPLASRADDTVLSVTGEGRIDAVPDMAVISLTISREAATAQEAMAQMGQAAQSVLAALQGMGLEPRDIQSGRLDLTPVWDHSQTRPGEGPRVTGYSASTGYDLRLRDLDALGTVLDRAVADGGNGFQGFRLTVANPRPLEDAAREAAISDARAKAEIYAKAAGLRITGIKTITEQGTGGQPRPMMEAMLMRSADAAPIAAGEVAIEVTVAVEFELEP